VVRKISPSSTDLSALFKGFPSFVKYELQKASSPVACQGLMQFLASISANRTGVATGS
ncbi:uncharacterized protein METZ01_LOCUS72903, partial [marine metagenome]